MGIAFIAAEFLEFIARLIDLTSVQPLQYTTLLAFYIKGCTRNVHSVGFAEEQEELPTYPLHIPQP